MSAVDVTMRDNGIIAFQVSVKQDLNKIIATDTKLIIHSTVEQSKF